MALKIRLRPQGRKNRQTYRLVVADIYAPIDGKYLEMLGWYDPCLPEKNADVNAERLMHWVGQGAQISERVENLLARCAPDAFKLLQKKREEQRMKRITERKELRKAK